MRIVFLGSGSFAIPCFEGLLDAGHDVAALVTQPDRERVYTATELLARAFCHEIDHVDGLLFVDRLSPLKRDLMRRKLRKKAREGWEE